MMNEKRLIKRFSFEYWLLGIATAILGLASISFALPRIGIPSAKGLPFSPPHQILLKFRSGAAAGARALTAAGLAPTMEIAGIGVHVLPVPPSQSAHDMIAELKTRYGTDLVYAEEDHARYAVLTPNDPLYSSQYHLPKINAPAAWDTTTGAGVTIAIADTGVTTTHPDLAAHLLTGHNVIDGSSDVTDTVGHGTGVAGAAAAVGNNGVGVTGVAFNARILPIKISADGTSSESLIAAAIIYAADHGAKVVNVSFNTDVPAPDGCWGQTVLSAAAYMQSKGGLVIVAAGNAGINKGCPNNPEMIDVSATDSNDQLASFSNFGSEIDVAAPGVGIVTTNCTTCSELPGFDYAIVDGTSFAAPITAGVVALIYAVNPLFTSAQVQQILFRSTTDLGAPGYDNSFGWGRVNAQSAVSSAQLSSATVVLTTFSNVHAFPNPWDARKNPSLRQITITGIPDTATIKIFTLSGYWVKTLASPSNGSTTWDLTNDRGDSVASGLYFYLVSYGADNAKGTIAIIK